jgi:hypothetical protein
MPAFGWSGNRRQWSIGNDRDLVLLTIRKQVLFNPAALQVVEHLVGNKRVFSHGCSGFLQFFYRKVAHADVPDQSGVCQGFHSSHGLLDRHAGIGPMDLVQVNVIGAQLAQAALAARIT